ncbi:MAG TPA: hypothetical protein ENK66_00250 [Arcobacter sp.]|nr:hypothetical protein [Arcobacter sp.]
MKKRYIVLTKEKATQKIMKSLEQKLDMKLVSSKELNSQVKAKDILATKSGLYFKNLGVSVVDIEEDKLLHILSQDNTFLYYEDEREFYPVEEFEELNNIKNTLEILNQQVRTLEKNLNTREEVESPQSNIQAYTHNMKTLSLDKSKYSGKNINVAILDTGLYLKHPDFLHRQIKGKSFIEGESWDFDGSGHGTHCTGVALGYLSSEKNQRYGIAYEANIFIGKVLSDKGRGLTSSILNGIDWALEKKCQVISLSLGSPTEIGEKPSVIFEHIGRKALEQGTLIVAAAGNNSQRPNHLPKAVSSPANVESIMAIAALNENLTVANFSNAGLNAGDGGRIDISAPGINILSSYSKNAKDAKLYRYMNGTSMATPHVSGVAALYFEAFPNLTASEIWLKIEKDSQELEQQRKRDIGSGLVQAI